MTGFKYLFAFRTPARAEHDVLLGSLAKAVEDTAHIADAAVDLPAEQQLYERLGRRPNVDPAWDALFHVVVRSRVEGQRAALESKLSAVIDIVDHWLLEHETVWSRPVPPGAVGHGVKQVSFVAKPAALSATEFEERYRRHQPVAAIHHEGAIRYAQNVVLEASSRQTGRNVSAVSEMWFASEADLIDRYYTTPQSRTVTQADAATFLDPERTTWMLVRETKIHDVSD